MFTFLVKRSQIVEVIIVKLKKCYNLMGGRDLQWFLGIKIIRDRRRRYVALI